VTPVTDWQLALGNTAAAGILYNTCYRLAARARPRRCRRILYNTCYGVSWLQRLPPTAADDDALRYGMPAVTRGRALGTESCHRACAKPPPRSRPGFCLAPWRSRARAAQAPTDSGRIVSHRPLSRRSRAPLSERVAAALRALRCVRPRLVACRAAACGQRSEGAGRIPARDPYRCIRRQNCRIIRR
jgi:hypothetical protein